MDLSNQRDEQQRRQNTSLIGHEINEIRRSIHRECLQDLRRYSKSEQPNGDDAQTEPTHKQGTADRRAEEEQQKMDDRVVLEIIFDIKGITHRVENEKRSDIQQNNKKSDPAKNGGIARVALASTPNSRPSVLHAVTAIR